MSTQWIAATKCHHTAIVRFIESLKSKSSSHNFWNTSAISLSRLFVPLCCFNIKTISLCCDEDSILCSKNTNNAHYFSQNTISLFKCKWFAFARANEQIDFWNLTFWILSLIKYNNFSFPMCFRIFFFLFFMRINFKRRFSKWAFGVASRGKPDFWLVKVKSV